MNCKLTIAVIILIAGYTGNARCDAAEIPHRFRGVWADAGSLQDKCRKSDHRIDRNTDDEAIVAIDARKMMHSESGCNVFHLAPASKKASTPALPNEPIQIDLTCSGEGETDNEHEIWSVQRAFDRDVMVIYNKARNTVVILSRCE